MDAFASPSIRPRGLGSRAFRAAEAVLVTIVLGLALVGIPGTANSRLDASWQLMLIHAHQDHLQFGRDVIFTWGPWGFLCTSYNLGRLEAVPILAWQTAGQFLVAFSLVALTRGLVLWRRLAFAALFLAFHWVFADVVYFVLIAFIVLAGLMRQDASLLRLVAWALFLGFLSQLKFTYLALSSAGIAAAMVCWAGRGSWNRVGAVAGAYVLSVLGWWCAAGQNPDNLYPYLRRSVELASGYGDAMGMDESLPVFLWGAAVALLCVVALWKAWRALPERPFALASCGYLAFSLFAMWKEGFTRADLVPLGGHVFGWFLYVLVLAPAVPGLLFPGRRLGLFDCLPLVCLVAIASFDPELYRQDRRIVWERAYGNSRGLGRLGLLPQEWQASYEKASGGLQLPKVQAAVGRKTVDVYDFNTDIALMNGLNLDARPIFQGYTAFTPSLEGWNLRHYQSSRAPDFLLWSNDRIDERYPGQDDAMLVAALPGHYEPLFQEGGFWLFRRTSPIPTTRSAHRTLISRTVFLSQEIVLPSGLAEAVWLEADAVPNNLGRLRSFLYKPAEIQISVTDDRGKTTLWRLMPRVARAGFLLVPTLASGDDAAALLRGETRSGIRSFHFEAPAGQEEFWSRVAVVVSSIPSLPLRIATHDRPAPSSR
jgi:hypothetical protein